MQGRIVELNKEKRIRCLNCSQLHADNKSIVNHWNDGKCLHFCTICGESFHKHIDDIGKHFNEVHGIKYQTFHALINLTKKDNQRNPSKKRKIAPKPIDIKKMLHCPECPQIFMKQTDLNVHLTHHKLKIISDIKRKVDVKQPILSLPIAKGITIRRNVRRSSVDIAPIRNKSKETISRSQIVPAKLSIKTEKVTQQFGNYANLAHFSSNEIEISKVSKQNVQCNSKSSINTTAPPRLQVKKLTDLQDPGFAMNTEYSSGSSMDYQSAFTELNPLNQNNSMESMQMATYNYHQPLHISLPQQVQHAQLYNPIFVAQAAQNPVQIQPYGLYYN